MSDSPGTSPIRLPILYSTSAGPEDATSPVPTNGASNALDALLDSPPNEALIEKDEMYHLDFVEFLVENRLYQVPKHQFTKQTNSSYFWESIEPVVHHGNAIKLEGVQQVDFRALVKLLYPLDLIWGSPPEPTPEEWKSILKLSFKWQMYDLFERAVNALTKALPLTEQVQLARTYGAYDWLKSTYTKLIQRSTFISEDEAKSLGLGASLTLVRIREQLCWSEYKAKQPDSDVTLRGIFDGPVAHELQDLKGMNDAGVIPTTIEQVMLGRAYGVRKWVQDGYKELSERNEPITLDEGTVLGLETAISLCAARNRVLRLNSEYKGCLFTAVEREVVCQFWEELNRLAEINGRYGNPPLEPMPTPPSAATESSDRTPSPPPRQARKSIMSKKKGKK